MNKIKRGIAFFLLFVMMLSCISEHVFAAEVSDRETRESTEIAADAETSGIFSQEDSSELSTTFFEVKFEMPENFEWVEGLTDELQEAQEQAQGEAAYEETDTEADDADNQGTYQEPDVIRSLIDLPETSMLREGTLISTIPAPSLLGYVFLGWYYDKDLTLKAGAEDVVDRNLTLYPRFGSAEEDGGNGLTLEYISAQDVPPDYVILLAVYGGLTEEEIRAGLVVSDASSLEETMEYSLTRQAPDLRILIPDEEQRLEVQEILHKYLQDDTEETEYGIPEGELPEDWEDYPEDLIEDAQGASQEDETPETEGTDKTPRWEKPDGSGFIYVSEEEIPLTDILQEAGLSESQIRNLIGYYAPEELEEYDAAILQDIMEKLGFDGDTPSEEALRIVQEMTGDETGSVSEDTGRLIRKYLEDDWEERYPDLYRIYPAEGIWRAGVTYQAHLLDTTDLRFFKDGELTAPEVVYYNIVIAQENYNNMKLGSHVIDIPASETDGIDLEDGGLVSIATKDYGDIEAVRNDRSGIFTYYGNETLSAGDVCFVHEDGYTIEDAFGAVGECPVTYIKITEDLGGNRFAFIMPEMDEIVFTPDVIPVFDDGSFEDGKMVLSEEQLDFSDPLYSDLELDPDLVIEPGDIILVFSYDENDPENSSLTGYGEITGVAPAEGGLQITYKSLSEAQLDQSGGFSEHQENIPLNFTDEELGEIGKQAVAELEANHAFSDARDYLEALVNADDSELQNAEYGNLLQDITFKTDTGEDISLEEVRELADGGLVYDDGFQINFQIAPTLKHFHGTGLRLVISCVMGAQTNCGTKGIIRIDARVQFEAEIAFGLSIDCWLKWTTKHLGKIPVKLPGGWDVYAATTTGYFFAVGFQITVQTQKRQETEAEKEARVQEAIQPGGKGSVEQRVNWKERFQSVSGFLDNINEITDFAGEGVHTQNGSLLKPGDDEYGTGDTVSTSDMHDSRYDYYTKYADFLSNSASFIPIYEGNIFKPRSVATFFGIIDVAFGIKFKLSWKLNVMIGATIQGGSCKQNAITVSIPSFDTKTTNADLETPNFLVDVYLFGELGLRATFEVEFKLGIVSAKLNSVGVVIELGAQVVFYGFLYIYLSWTEGEGWDKDVLGSLLLEVDLLFSVKVKAQVLNDSHSVEYTIVSVRWPILTLGTERVFVEMKEADDEDPKAFDVEVDSRKSSAALKKNTLTVMSMEMNSGLTSNMDMDSHAAVDGDHMPVAYLNGTFTQKDEEFFDIEIVDTDEDGKSLGHADASWYYDPETDQIYARPHSLEDGELWGQVTFRFHNYRSAGWHEEGNDKVNAVKNYGMGFGLLKTGIERTINVHWKGIPATVTPDIYLQTDPFVGIEAIDELSGASESDLDSMYEPAGSGEPLKTFVGLTVQGGADEKYLNWDPNYELAFIEEAYNEDIVRGYSGAAYKKYPVQKANNARLDVYKDSGKFWVLPEDTMHTFMAEEEDTHISLYFNRIKLDSHWLLLDAESENQLDFGTTDVIIPKGERIMDYLPEQIREGMEDPGYDYTVYYVLDQKMYMLAKNMLKNGLRALNYPSSFPARSWWTEVTEETITPDSAFYVFVERTPKKNRITWMYEEGERLTFLKPGEEVKPPYAGDKTGYLLESWADENGVWYDTMPEFDLVLYPTYVGKEHSILWDYNGERRNTTLRVGDLILEVCPFDELHKENLPANQDIRWRIGSASRGVIVQAEDTMPDRNFVLFADLITYRNVTWKMGDSILATTMEVAGDPLALFEPELEEGMVCRWMKDGELLQEGYVMPDEDIVLDALVYDKDHSHDWQVVGTYVLPTCTEGSQRHEKCSICLEERDAELYPDPEAHDWGSPVYTWDEDYESCTAVHYCKRDPSHFEMEIADARSTLLEEWNCEKDGKLDYTAVFENPSFETQETEELVKAQGHVEGIPVKENEKEATCSEEGGYDEVYYCEVCGEAVRTEHKTIGKTDHVPSRRTVTENAISSTCSEEGSYEEVTYCRVCGEEINREKKTIAKKKHTPGRSANENYEAATCQTEGSYERVTYCRICGEEISRKTVKVPVTKHQPGDAVIENATEGICDNGGTYEEVIYCSVCGKQLSRKTKKEKAPGHKPDEPVQEDVKEATCTEEGSCEEVVYCSVCGEEISRETKSIPALGHTPEEAVEENEEAATCTEEGSCEEVVYCSMCGEEISRETKSIPALGHEPLDAVKENITDPTCTEEGSYDEVVYCDRCGEELSREEKAIPQTGHEPMDSVEENTTEPTCTEEGSYDEVVYCSVCGEEVSRETKTVPVLDHTPGEPVRENEVPATCMEEGSVDIVVYCTVCGEELSREEHYIEVSDVHTPSDPVKENDLPATCEEDGFYDEVVYCSVCTEELSRERIDVPALGHSFGSYETVQTVAPTCDRSGWNYLGYEILASSCVHDGCNEKRYSYAPTGEAPGHVWTEDSWSYECDQITHGIDYDIRTGTITYEDGWWVEWFPGSADLTCKLCGYHTEIVYKPVKMDVKADWIAYNENLKLFTVTNPDLLSLDATFRDLLNYVGGYIGSKTGLFYLELDGIYTLDQADERLRDHQGETLLLFGTFTPFSAFVRDDYKDEYDPVYFAFLVTVPTE